MIREMNQSANTQNLYTLKARLDCLEHLGWKVDETSETWREVFIPDPLDAVWERYNKLQIPSGFDLTKHQGKKATCYTYIATNFPYDVGEPVYVNLLIIEGTLIGGDCMTNALDGFMLPLNRRHLP